MDMLDTVVIRLVNHVTQFRYPTYSAAACSHLTMTLSTILDNSDVRSHSKIGGLAPLYPRQPLQLPGLLRSTYNQPTRMLTAVDADTFDTIITRGFPCGTVTAQFYYRSHDELTPWQVSQVDHTWGLTQLTSSSVISAHTAHGELGEPPQSLQYIAIRNTALMALCSTSLINLVIGSQPNSQDRQINICTTYC